MFLSYFLQRDIEETVLRFINTSFSICIQSKHVKNVKPGQKCLIIDYHYAQSYYH